jgi:hypothetical protein
VDGEEVAELSEIPNPVRRRTSGFLFLGGAVLASLGAAIGLPKGLFAIAAVLAAIGFWFFGAAWRLTTTADDALAVAGEVISFEVGHGSAAVTFDGWRARPVWQVMAYSADDPPTTRAIVRVDGVTGEVVGDPFVEAVSAPS